MQTCCAHVYPSWAERQYCRASQGLRASAMTREGSSGFKAWSTTGDKGIVKPHRIYTMRAQPTGFAQFMAGSETVATKVTTAAARLGHNRLQLHMHQKQEAADSKGLQTEDNQLSQSLELLHPGIHQFNAAWQPWHPRLGKSCAGHTSDGANPQQREGHGHGGHPGSLWLLVMLCEPPEDIRV